MHANIISDDEARVAELLRGTRRVAVLGIKTEAQRDQPGFYVAEALHAGGLEIVPVPVYYPEATEILGARCTAASPTCRARSTSSTSSAAGATCRRTSTTSSPSAPRAVWLQLGIRDDESAERFADAGILVVQDRCLMVDWRRYAARH